MEAGIGRRKEEGKEEWVRASSQVPGGLCVEIMLIGKGRRRAGQPWGKTAGPVSGMMSDLQTVWFQSPALPSVHRWRYCLALNKRMRNVWYSDTRLC